MNGEVWVQAPQVEALLRYLVDEVARLRRAVESANDGGGDGCTGTTQQGEC